jgi:hypothetical protein
MPAKSEQDIPCFFYSENQQTCPEACSLHDVNLADLQNFSARAKIPLSDLLNLIMKPGEIVSLAKAFRSTQGPEGAEQLARDLEKLRHDFINTRDAVAAPSANRCLRNRKG